MFIGQLNVKTFQSVRIDRVWVWCIYFIYSMLRCIYIRNFFEPHLTTYSPSPTGRWPGSVETCCLNNIIFWKYIKYKLCLTVLISFMCLYNTTSFLTSNLTSCHLNMKYEHTPEKLCKISWFCTLSIAHISKRIHSVNRVLYNLQVKLTKASK